MWFSALLKCHIYRNYHTLDTSLVFPFAFYCSAALPAKCCSKQSRWRHIRGETIRTNQQEVRGLEQLTYNTFLVTHLDTLYSEKPGCPSTCFVMLIQRCASWLGKSAHQRKNRRPFGDIKNCNIQTQVFCSTHHLNVPDCNLLLSCCYSSTEKKIMHCFWTSTLPF